MVKKVIVLLMCLVLLSSLACACQIRNEQSGESSNDPSNLSDLAIPEWKTAYLDLIETTKDTYCSYSLVHIDSDDVPELYLSGTSEATGDSICSYKNGTVIEQQLHRIGGGLYVEKSGNIINQNGHLGDILVHVYKLTEDGFTLTFSARSIERLTVSENSEYAICYEYSIGDEPVNEAEYTAAIETAFNFVNAKRFKEDSVEYDSIRQQILNFN